MNDTVNIFMCGNSGVGDGIILAALSLVKHSDRVINLIIGTMDLSNIDVRYTPVSRADADTVEKILTERNPDSRVTLVDMGREFRREMSGSKNLESSYTPYAMLRLLADLFPMPEKLLYIDCDVLFARDVSLLWDTDVSDYHLAGVRDHYGRWFINPNYINSGVMLWNLKKMREDGVLAACRELCVKKKMLFFDQDAINKYAKRKLYLPSRFNDQHGYKKNTVIQHFSMYIKWIPFRTEAVKPWQPELMHSRLGLYEYDDIIEKWREIKSNG